MELAEAMRRRRMARRYDPARAVPDPVVDRLVSAALRAPTAGHTQGVSFLVLRHRDDIETYWRVTAPDDAADRWLQGMRTAPLLILVWTSADAYAERYARPDKGWVDRDPRRWSAPFWFVDAGMASMAALLTAVDAELGACFFGVPPERETAVREQFGVPQEQLSVGVVSVGYPTPDARSVVAARRSRLPREERVHEGRWGGGKTMRT